MPTHLGQVSHHFQAHLLRQNHAQLAAQVLYLLNGRARHQALVRLQRQNRLLIRLIQATAMLSHCLVVRNTR